MNFGFMQGRLVDSEKTGQIQYFPSKNWKKEIILSNSIGFNIMEWTINYENINSNHLFNQKKNQELIKILNTNNVSIPSVTCDFFMQRPSFKNKKNKKTLKDLKKIIKLSRNIGVKFIILPLVDNSSINGEIEEKVLIKQIKEIIKILDNKQKILFEIDYPPNKIISFLKKFNFKVGINYDTGNSASMGYSFEEEKNYFNYVYNIHIKDRKFRGSSVRLGQGDFNFRTFFNFLKKIKYNKNLIFQTARSQNHINEILRNKKFVSKFI